MSATLLEQVRQLGFSGSLALALLGVCVWLWISAIRPMEGRLGDIERHIAAANTDFDGPLKTTRNDGPDKRLQRFYDYLRRRERAEDWLAKLYGIAKSEGLELASADYRLSDRRERIEHYQVTLPVRGSYAQVRGFTGAALAEIPVLSLDQVSFRRKTAHEARLEAEIVFTLHSLSP